MAFGFIKIGEARLSDIPLKEIKLFFWRSAKIRKEYQKTKKILCIGKYTNNKDSEDMKIPFDIKFRPQIESGEYKVETRDGRPVKIVSFEITDSGELPIAAQFRLCAGTPVIYLFDKNGEYKGEGPSDYDLFLITPEPELTEFEQSVRNCIIENLTTHGREGSSIVFIDDDTAKKMAAELLELAESEIYSRESLVKYAERARAEGKAEAMNDLPRWRRIKERGCLPCRAYLYNLAYEVENNFLGKCHVDGFLVPNEAVQVGCDTWYLPVDEIKNLPKED